MKPAFLRILVALTIAACGSTGNLIMAPPTASAPRGLPPGGPSPTPTTGVIGGSVIDASGPPLLLVTIVATSPALQGTQSEFTDAEGHYFLRDLPPGVYTLTFIYGDAKVKRENVSVFAGQSTAVGAVINTESSGEVITIKEKSPVIDGGSTRQGIVIGQDQLRNVPSAGRTWSGTLGSSKQLEQTRRGGAQGDTYGTSFSGSTRVENNAGVDGRRLLLDGDDLARRLGVDLGVDDGLLAKVHGDVLALHLGVAVDEEEAVGAGRQVAHVVLAGRVGELRLLALQRRGGGDDSYEEERHTGRLIGDRSLDGAGRLLCLGRVRGQQQRDAEGAQRKEFSQAHSLSLLGLR